ncbi:MAG: hypothetical protein U1E65_29365 [Myxococcota bacterium]
MQLRFALAAALGLSACADVNERVAIDLNSSTKSLILVEDVLGGPLRVSALTPAMITAPVLVTRAATSTVVLLEYSESLADLGLAEGEVSPGDCRGIPEPLVARRAAAGGLSAPGTLDTFSHRAALLRIECRRCASRSADARGRCLLPCQGRLVGGVCSTTCHDGSSVDGAGLCPNSCLAEQLLDVRGVCIDKSECPAGFIIDAARGVCYAAGSCPGVLGIHDGGDGTCAPIRSCLPGFFQAGNDVCLPLGSACLPGFHDRGDGTCWANGFCMADRHDGGDGACVGTSTCSRGYALVPALGCLPLETCAVGQHDGGTGVCVPENFCAAGFGLDDAGVCFRITHLAPMGTARFGFALGGSGDGQGMVAVGGNNQNQPLTDSIEVYDPAQDRWHPAAPLPTPLIKPTWIRLSDGRIFLFSGFTETTWTERFRSFLLIETDGRWHEVHGAPRFRPDGASLTLLPDGRVMITMGATDGSMVPVGGLEIFDPGEETWTELSGPPMQSLIPGSILLDARRVLLLGGGRVHNVPSTLSLIWDLSDGTFHTATPPLVTHLEAPLYRFDDGRILLAGGWVRPGTEAGVPTADAEIYDPSADTWRSVQPLASAHYGAGTARLCDGRVLVVDGLLRPFQSNDTAEIFDPRSETWSSLGTVPPARVGLLAFRRRDCSVALVGGADDFEMNATHPLPTHTDVALYQSPGLRVRR